MDINDYKGISYLKFLVPSIFIICWLGMIFGPKITFLHYRQFALMFGVYFISKTAYQLVLMINLVVKGNAALERAKSQQKHIRPAGIPFQEIYHAFAIPSYKQDIQLLAETLEVLAKHERAASTYLIFMAMEEHQQGSDIKAQQLIARFKTKFRNIDYTRHKVRELQQKGKASNVSWCVEHMEEKFKTMMINPEDVFVTVMDADSWAPNAYFNQVQDHIYNDFQSRHISVFQPTQILSRNNMEVPIFIRTYDDMFAAFHAGSISACCGPVFPLSNYTMSYSLIKRVGFWDTVEQAIGQDLHMCIKSHFKTAGQLKTIAIYTPFNQLNIQTGNGYIEDVKAKFWQLERHGRALIDLGYCILMLIKNAFNPKLILMFIVIVDNMLMPIMLPYPILSTLFEDQILHLDAPTEGLATAANFMLLFNIGNAIPAMIFLLYDYYKRKSSKILYGIEGPSIIHAIEVPLFLVLNAGIVMTVSYVISSFSGLKKNRQYRVADKAASTMTRNKMYENKNQESAFITPTEQQNVSILSTEQVQN